MTATHPPPPLPHKLPILATSHYPHLRLLPHPSPPYPAPLAQED